MDKHCKGCFYQVFKDDTRKIWGFCGYKDIIKECKSKMNPDVDLPNMNGYLKKLLKEMSNVKDSIPSCMFVQTCFDGKCPYYRKDKEMYLAGAFEYTDIAEDKSNEDEA